MHMAVPVHKEYVSVGLDFACCTSLLIEINDNQPQMLILLANHQCRGQGMEYRGKPYSVVLSMDRKWKWTVEIDGHKSGFAASRPLAEAHAKKEIDNALAPAKLKRQTQPVRSDRDTGRFAHIR